MTTEEEPVYKPRNTKDPRHPEELGRGTGQIPPHRPQHGPTLPTL